MAKIDLYKRTEATTTHEEKEKKVAPKKESIAAVEPTNGIKPITIAEPKEHIFTHRLLYSDFPPIFDELRKPVKILANLVLNNEETILEQPKPLNDIRPDELKKEIELETEQLADKVALDPQDVELTAEIIVEVIDMIVSGVCRWIAQDDTDSSYVLSERRMERLKIAIVKYMSTVKVASSPLGMLIVLLLIIMFTPILKAFKNRKKNKTAKTYQMPPKEEKYTEFEEVEQEDIDDFGFDYKKSA